MTEVTFYILPSQSQQERQTFACKLTEKIYRNGQFCYILTDTEQQNQQIDNQLWTFRAGSFIPHQIYHGECPQYQGTVLIGTEPIPEQWQKVVVNLSSTQPQPTEHCERILEILDNGETTKQMGRNRYRHYQQAGLKITTHKL